MSKGTYAWDHLSTDSAQLLLCNLQPEIVARSKTIPRDVLSNSAAVLLEIARLFSLPTTMRVVPEGDTAPELIPRLRGSGFAQEKLRASASPFFDESTKNLFAQLKHKVLVIVGFATEAVVLIAVPYASAQGYEVLVPVNVCGGMSELTEQAALMQIRAAGAITTLVESIATKLAPDFTTGLGKSLFTIVKGLRLTCSGDGNNRGERTSMKTQTSVAWSEAAAHKSGFVTANGIRLHYLDWGGLGPVLILIHGGLDNAHIFDDLAPAFTEHFRVIAYDLRGHGRSEAKGPFDTTTRTEDLRGLMDSLGVAKAHLAGWSLGGNDITAMAGTHPERVDAIVYLEGAYDWGGPALAEAFKSLPIDFLVPASAMRSLAAYQEYQKTIWFPGLSDTSRFEAYVRDLVVMQSDGTVRARMTDSAAQAVLSTVLTNRPDYNKVPSPALAIYADTFFDVRNGDPAQLAKNLAWEQKYMAPFRAASIERVRRELPSVEIVKIPGTHKDFVFTSRELVVSAMQRFLGETEKGS